MKVLFVTSEVSPLIKTGGLADVSGALPAALRAIGVDVRILVPGYNKIMEKLGSHNVIAILDSLPGFPPAKLLSGTMSNGVPLLVIDCPVLYHREGGPYLDSNGLDWSDNAMRFGFLSRVAALLGCAESPLDWHPDLVHCNDWQTGLVPAYLSFTKSSVPSVFSVHNLLFQGVFPRDTLWQLQLPLSSFSINGIEYHDQLSFLKAGLFYSDHITTVSKNYADEIQQDELGFGMQGLLSTRNKELTGILNGIDVDEWNPATDIHLPQKYSKSRMTGKAANKQALQSRMGLNVDAEVPLLGVVSRLTHQKGLDLLLEIAPLLTELPAQLVLLGTGEESMEKSALELVKLYPGKIAAYIGFSEEISHQIEAGADLFVMPSRFEPCGLNQLYSQRYGTPPIVHATGGLADSVIDCTPESLAEGTASGFAFSGMTAENMLAVIKRAICLYHNKPKWKVLRKNCMEKDSSWKHSAEAYVEVYLKVLGRESAKVL